MKTSTSQIDESAARGAQAATVRLVDALRDPACFPHGVSARPIAVVETHVSFIP